MSRAITTDFDLDSFLPYQLAVLSSRVSGQFSEIYSKKFCISIPEWRVIAHLSQADNVSVREIHVKVDMDKSKVSRAASRLEIAGYLTKADDGTDRRLISLSLTPKGRAIVDEIMPLARNFETKITRNLSPEENKTFQILVKKLMEQEQ